MHAWCCTRTVCRPPDAAVRRRKRGAPLPVHCAPQVSFQEILVALRAVDCVSGKGTHARGFGASGGAAHRGADTERGGSGAGRDAGGYGSSRDGRSGGGSRAGDEELPSVWELQEFR